MPTSATHVTVVQLVANNSATMKSLLGDPAADPDTPDGIKMRFAKLGSTGPDIFYALADYGGDLQALENFMVKVAGSASAIAELMGGITRYVDGTLNVLTLQLFGDIKKTFDLIVAAVNEGLLALLVGPAGANFWPVFEPARQKDLPREKWYWADYLHYIKSGEFAFHLIQKAKLTGNDKLVAYAYGYLTHYVTDVVGHPYVNQVVEAPWRLYWQRHHLVENFIDAYVWDRWHTSNVPPVPPPTGGPGPTMSEPPLDSLASMPNVVGTGAPVTYARINDHINIGDITLGDPVDMIVEAVADKIKHGLFDIGVAENIDPEPPLDADFQAWCKLMEETIAEVYTTKNGARIPENLKSNIVPGIPASRDGHPTKEDIGAAYGVFRLVQKTMTEEKIAEPRPPNTLTDISNRWRQRRDQP
jgi:Zinc dependent phospholipase C